jgi:hypothetical protein
MYTRRVYFAQGSTPQFRKEVQWLDSLHGTHNIMTYNNSLTAYKLQ